MIAKRLFDLICATISLILLAPLFLVIALWIKVDGPGPVFFRQERVGRFGQPFRIFKLRTMVADAEAKGPLVSLAQDARVTRGGAYLRKYKLDELPQLINVLRGEMSFVGPRPEVPKYVAHYPPEVRDIVLSVRPGLTDYAAIEFRNEADFLKEQSDPELFYLREILPEKLKLYQKYVENRSFLTDIKLILRTIKCVATGA